MDVRNCRRCNKIFQYRGNKYCASCMLDLDEIFTNVREYIYDNPDSNIMEVSNKTGVEEDIILQFLREGRLELTSATLDFLCERCEKPIITGRFCGECIDELNREMKRGLGEAAQESLKEKSDSRKMYTADYRGKKYGR